MAYFYREGRLQVGSHETFADIGRLVEAEDRPCYIYDLDDIEHRYHALKRALAGLNNTVHYAMKANSHPAILASLARWDAGVDTVSGGEIRLATAAGFAPERIIFSGVAKTRRELEHAITLGIKQINVESSEELERIASIAQHLGKTAQVAFRMNPDVNPKTHPYITTGFRENKFGMDESFIPALIETLRRHPTALKLRGLTMHIGSQLFDLAVMQEAIEKILAVHRQLESEGFILDRLDIGGGLGVDYSTEDTTPEFSLIESYGAMVQQTLTNLLGHVNLEVLTEPGRVLVGRSGVLVGEVQYVKKAPAKTFAILDTGMNHLIRPALYSAVHRVLPVAIKGEANRLSLYDVVGPICESADFLAKDVKLPDVKSGDRLALADAGAYGFVMASHYNAHELPRELIISQGKKVSHV